LDLEEPRQQLLVTAVAVKAAAVLEAVIHPAEDATLPRPHLAIVETQKSDKPSKLPSLPEQLKRSALAMNQVVGPAQRGSVFSQRPSAQAASTERLTAIQTSTASVTSSSLPLPVSPPTA